MRGTMAALVLSIAVGVALLLGVVGCGEQGASSYPTKEITYIVQWGQGGAADGIARALADATSPHLGKPIIVKNIPGGSGTLGATELVNSKPDGYTVAQQQGSVVTIGPHMQDVPWKSPDDFQILSMVFTFPFVWSVKADSPYKNLEDIIADAKKRPGEITFSFSGVGTGGHLAMEGLAKKLGIKLKIVPFKTAAEGVTALLGGHIDTSLSHPPDVATHIKEGRLRPIAAFSSFPGMETIPGLKSLKELGYDYEASAWSCNVVPKGTPKDVVERLRTAFKKGMEEKSFVDYMAKTMQPINYKTADETLAVWKADYEAMGALVKELGLKK